MCTKGGCSEREGVEREVVGDFWGLRMWNAFKTISWLTILDNQSYQ